MSEELAQLDLVQLLARLEPLPAPPPVPLWPQTAGWLWLAIAVLAAAAWAVLVWIRRRRAEAYRRAALRRIAAVGDDPVALAEILRRTALAAYPRGEVAGLHGEAWLEFLDRGYGGSGFRDGPGRVLAKAPYAPVEASPDLASLAAQWVRRHRRAEARAR